MIYKKHDIERMVGRRLFNDFWANLSLAFTNTSFGAHGEVLGSLVGKDDKNHTETKILYTLVREHLDSDEVNLKKEITVVAWPLKKNGKVIREYSKTETSEIIMTLYTVSNSFSDVYTDDPVYAATSQNLYSDRHRLNNCAPVNNKKLVTDLNRYAKFVEYIAKHEGHALKAGTPIYEEVRRGAVRAVYDCAKQEYVKKKYIEHNLYYVYRNKNYFCTKSHFEF